MLQEEYFLVLHALQMLNIKKRIERSRQFFFNPTKTSPETSIQPVSASFQPRHNLNRTMHHAIFFLVPNFNWYRVNEPIWKSEIVMTELIEYEIWFQ